MNTSPRKAGITISRTEAAADHPDMTPKFAALLSTSQVKVDYRIESSVRTGDDARDQ
ncbi:hypothetical protein [Halalkalicoccus subterraneus]|uniref:hypothetical protein n=1 Tax=Halalkalicoccus subterraneus TaxID=2675002 RepID=UPI0013CE7569|nr:hypothetical protein [Halalkalicoccus subterraneus]